MNFKVTLTGKTALPAEVAFATQDVTAKAGEDYEANSGRLRFEPGETEKSITVRISGDRTFEPDETFLVKLSTPVDAAISKAEAIGTIVTA